jgi:hypothetical protein
VTHCPELPNGLHRPPLRSRTRTRRRTQPSGIA